MSDTQHDRLLSEAFRSPPCDDPDDERRVALATWRQARAEALLALALGAPSPEMRERLRSADHMMARLQRAGRPP